MINRFLILMVLSIYFLVFAQRDTVPVWLDTLAPIITVLPQKKFQKRPFTVSFSSSEQGAIFFAMDDTANIQTYSRSITINRSGRSVIFFCAEDMFGNRSILDSVAFELDMIPPKLDISVPSGTFRNSITVECKSNEPAMFFMQSDISGGDRKPIESRFTVNDIFNGYIVAIDRAGNTTRSNVLHYLIDTSSLTVAIHPVSGVYDKSVKLSFETADGVSAYYTFNTNALAEEFTLYESEVILSSRLTLVRYYAQNQYGNRSTVLQASYAIDTIPPNIRYSFKAGESYDTLKLYTKEKSIIRYSIGKHAQFNDSKVYNDPIIIQHKGVVFVKAVAQDKIGNNSERFIWERKYDHVAPLVGSSHKSGLYNRPVNLSFTSSEPVNIFYTVDELEPTESSKRFCNDIVISKSGRTVFKYIAYDSAGNSSNITTLEFLLDLKPPVIKAHIKGDPDQSVFNVKLSSNELASIYYTIDGSKPSKLSNKYSDPIVMHTNQVLRYFAIDMAGNRSNVRSMDELQKPMVQSKPSGGIYRSQVLVTFSCSMPSKIFLRILPDTLFVLVSDTFRIKESGFTTIEYFAESYEGISSPIKQSQYNLDWDPPYVQITVKKGVGDSLSIFFESNENASIYYTTDGTSPLFSKTTKVAGNKLTRRNDRISLYRSSKAKLAFYAEDFAGNQSSLSILDVFKPHVIPNIPAGIKNIYNKILSLSLNTYDGNSQIYYERHGKIPSLDSPIFSEPITLLESDTVRTLVVDASGYKGDIETFIYLIDLPPSPHFSFAPILAEVKKPVTFNASGTIDHESSFSQLIFKWDFNSDGKFDYVIKGDPISSYTFTEPGRYEIRLEVTDELKRTKTIFNDLLVKGVCPDGMQFIPRKNGASFCIDRYEWPNKKKKIPMANVSWIRAKMFCHDDGKRLCTANEWQYACDGGMVDEKGVSSRNSYPYGYSYEKGRCATDGTKIYESGSFENCAEGFNLHDMIGNVWEWVLDKQHGAPIMMGGAYSFGNKARCGFMSESSLVNESHNTGFRCCK